MSQSTQAGNHDILDNIDGAKARCDISRSIENFLTVVNSAKPIKSDLTKSQSLN